MPEDPEPQAEEPKPGVESAQSEEKEDEIGDFINRHVFEKDSVFFEG